MHTYQKLILAFLTLLVTILLIVNLHGPSSTHQNSHTTILLPTVPVFHADNSSFTDWSHHSDPVWDAILPSNGGHALSTNLSTGSHYWGKISMFHQLQCLLEIRKAFLVFTEHWDKAVTFVNECGKGSQCEKVGACFDYIRQGLLCHADSTLNPVAVTSVGGKQLHIMDGNALWHTCKDNKPLFEWAYASGEPRKDRLLFIDQDQ